LPSRHAVSLTLQFHTDCNPNIIEIRALADQLGYRLAEGSITITRHDNHEEWHVILIAKTKQQVSITAIAAGLQKCSSLSGYQVAFARN